ncbi:hypothetical protein M9Y10_009098 [Tritrichomonas musculus]|uniref:Uncharacterized protein n=1 Tax=Tritrichomonas musculus TaxID=1915356 RepID=A0ABR2J0X5_9EUKA
MDDSQSCRRSIRFSEDNDLMAPLYDEKLKLDFSNHLVQLRKGNPDEIARFMRYFQINSPEKLLTAITSEQNFHAFLKEAILSDNDFSQFNGLYVISLITNTDEDFSFLIDPQILTFLLQKINDDYYGYRLIALTIINNLLIQYRNTYDFFSQMNLANQLKFIADFRSESNNEEYMEAFKRKEMILDEISYTIYIITKEDKNTNTKLFKIEEAPILWDTLLFLFDQYDDTTLRRRIIGSMANIISAGFIGQISESMMDFFSWVVIDSMDLLTAFSYFVTCLPKIDDFFTELIRRGILDNMAEVIERDSDQNPEEIYRMLGEIRFATDNQDFMALTLKKLKGPAKYYTRVEIVYYLSRIIYPTSTALIQLLMNHDVFLDITEIMSSEEAEVVHFCLDFIYNVLDCYTKAFQKKASTFPSANIIETDLSEMVSKIDDEADEKIRIILEKFDE